MAVQDDDDALRGEDPARDAFDAGRAAYDQGRFDEALSGFRRAYRLSGRPELLFNLGLVQDRLRQDRDALESYRSYLDALPDAANRPAVEERIRVLQEEVDRDDALAAALREQDTRSEQHDGGDDLLTSPILWIIVGVVVVGAGVGIGVGVALSQDPGTAMPVPGPSGVVVTALSF